MAWPRTARRAGGRRHRSGDPHAAPEARAGGGGTLEADVTVLAPCSTSSGQRPPIRASSFEEAVREHERALARPRSVIPGLSLELEAVCLAALSRDPRARHPVRRLFPLGQSAASRCRCCLPTGRRQRASGGLVVGQSAPVPRRGSAVLGAALLMADWFTVQRPEATRGRGLRDAARKREGLPGAQARAVLALFEKFAAHAVRTAVEPGSSIAERGESEHRGEPARVAAYFRTNAQLRLHRNLHQ